MNFTNYKFIQFIRSIARLPFPMEPSRSISSGSDVKIIFACSRHSEFEPARIISGIRNPRFIRHVFVRRYKLALQHTFDSYGWVARFSTPLRETIVRFSSERWTFSCARERDTHLRADTHVRHVHACRRTHTFTGQIFKITLYLTAKLRNARTARKRVLS